MTREDIERLNDVRPYCFESDIEEQWYNIGLKDGLEIADNNPKFPWISVDDDLPCNPKYLKQPDYSPWVLAITENGEILSAQMIIMNGKWIWHSHVSRKHEDIRYWMPIILMLPKEYEHIWEFKL